MAKRSFCEFTCDNCGRKTVFKDDHDRVVPHGWYTISIRKWRGGDIGISVYHKELCCSKCVINILDKLKKLPRMKYHKPKLVCHS